MATGPRRAMRVKIIGDHDGLPARAEDVRRE